MVSENSATITVRVQRNKNCPQFESEPYLTTIDQTKQVNAEVLQIKAVDFDPQGTPFKELTHTLLGDDKGPTFFKIDETTGRITVKSDLKADSDTQYKV